jgi:hypothetical protein
VPSYPVVEQDSFVWVWIGEPGRADTSRVPALHGWPIKAYTVVSGMEPLAARYELLVYCCGPEPLLAAVEQRCAHWPPGALHVERFAAVADVSPREEFEVELARSGKTITVAPERSILETVEDAGVQVLSSCREHAGRAPAEPARPTSSRARPTIATHCSRSRSARR